jgi:hypothetical protein
MESGYVWNSNQPDRFFHPVIRIITPDKQHAEIDFNLQALR